MNKFMQDILIFVVLHLIRTLVSSIESNGVEASPE